MNVLWLAVGIVIGTFFGAGIRPWLVKAWEWAKALINRPKDPL